jgi:hypothetical protein
MRSQAGQGSVMNKPALRLGVVAALVAGVAFFAPHAALAQNTDDAHSFCAQGGGDDLGSGAGGGIVPSNADDPANETAAFGNGAAGGEDAGGNGGGGAGGGLGGAEGDGGGAGGCGPDIPDRVPPVIIRRVVGRRLPTTGSAADRVGVMGAGLLLVGGSVLAATRRVNRKEQVTPEGLVWDAFGWRPN